MAKQITIKDGLYERLTELKGDSSFSSVIESFMDTPENIKYIPERARAGSSKNNSLMNGQEGGD